VNHLIISREVFVTVLDSAVSLYLGTEKQVYDELLNQAGQFISPAKIQLLKLALSLHIYAPKVAMYKQVAEEQGVNATGCSAIALVANVTTCTPSDIPSVVRTLKVRKTKCRRVKKKVHCYNNKLYVYLSCSKKLELKILSN